MQLSRFTDYSIRALLYAAANREALVTMAEVSRFYAASPEHMRKVVHQLARLGYIETFKGKRGGFRLLSDPAQIRIGDVVQQTEGLEQLIDCLGQGCCLNPVCSLKKVLAQAQHAFIDQLNCYTLADLVDSKEMQQALSIEVRQLHLP